MHHQDPLHQDATQNRERSKLLLRKLSQTRERERGKERDQERERLHQLQSINNLLIDLPPPPSPTHLPNYSQDASSSSQSDKNVSIDGEMKHFLSCLLLIRCTLQIKSMKADDKEL